MNYLLTKLGLLIGLQSVNVGAIYLALTEMKNIHVISSIEILLMVGSLFLLAKMNFMMSKFIKETKMVKA